MDIQVHQADRLPQIFNARQSSSRQITIKLCKIKEEKRQFLKQQEQKCILYKTTLIRLSADIAAEALYARQEWEDIFKELKEKMPTMKT